MSVKHSLCRCQFIYIDLLHDRSSIYLQKILPKLLILLFFTHLNKFRAVIGDFDHKFSCEVSLVKTLQEVFLVCVQLRYVLPLEISERVVVFEGFNDIAIFH